MKKFTLTKKSSLTIAHSILWGTAMVSSSIVLQGERHAEIIFFVLGFLGAISLMVDSAPLTQKKQTPAFTRSKAVLRRMAWVREWPIKNSTERSN